MPTVFKNLWAKTKGTLGQGFEVWARLFEGRPASEAAPAEVVYRRKQWAHFAYAILFSAVFSAVIVAPGPDYVDIPQVNAGDVANVTIRSPLTARVEPRDLPASERDALMKKVSPVFDYDDRAIPNWLQNWEKVFQTVQGQVKAAKITSLKASGALETDRLAQTVQAITGQELSREDLIWLHQHKFNESIEKTFMMLAKPLIGRLVAAEDLFPTYYGTGIVIRQIQLGLNEALIQDVSRIWSLDHARQLIGHVLATLPQPTSVLPVAGNGGGEFSVEHKTEAIAELGELHTLLLGCNMRATALCDDLVKRFGAELDSDMAQLQHAVDQLDFARASELCAGIQQRLTASVQGATHGTWPKSPPDESLNSAR